FDFVWIMTGGGPANGTMLPGPLAYQQAFVQFQYGNGSAIIVLTVLLMVVLSLIYVRVTTPRDLTKADRRARVVKAVGIVPAPDMAAAAENRVETLETTTLETTGSPS
ncbi:MAG: sugar transporter permease, partial [Microbacteriaceae bacterium]|nr:sugar transporter permease [Microbacteriaceae bacterium]